MGQDSSANVSDGRRFREELPLRTAVSSLEFLRQACIAVLLAPRGCRYGRMFGLIQSILDVERDGLRPCPRCFPLLIACDDTLTDRVRKVCRYIETHASESLKLADLAKNAGLSPFHFQRSFKAVVGVTPKQYLEALRLNNLKEGLRQYGGWLI